VLPTALALASNPNRHRQAGRVVRDGLDLPLNFHPTALRASAGFYAVGRGWSNVRSAELVWVAQPIARCGEIGGRKPPGREVAQRRVRPPLVVIVDPVRNP